jgi:hypothetical protein
MRSEQLRKAVTRLLTDSRYGAGRPLAPLFVRSGTGTLLSALSAALLNEMCDIVCIQYVSTRAIRYDGRNTMNLSQSKPGRIEACGLIDSLSQG